MKNKLCIFSEFANQLFPHETDYLLRVQQFQKSENLKILELINYNCKNPGNLLPYDKSIDKRTYSYLKKWISETLSKIDVDIFFEWLVALERKVMSDSISPFDEKAIIEKTKTISSSHYYFLKFFEVVQQYRDYLMVRNRTGYYQQVSTFLKKYQTFYSRSIELNHQLNQVAEKIAGGVSPSDEEFHHWRNFFFTIFSNDLIDGYTRYRAVVRLTILYYTNREFEGLRPIYENLDELFKTDIFYSKRILANYYANRAMMHSKLNELDLSVSYGYLSLKQKNSDYLFYLVNLCGVLHRKSLNQQALQLMVSSIPELKKTSSYYYKIGFVSFYIKTLIANHQYNKAADYGGNFFEGYRKEIMEHRWHLFFTSYIQALTRNEKYSRILSLNRRYKLVNKEKQFLGKAAYIPFIYWYTLLSSFMEGEINYENFTNQVLQSAISLQDNPYKIRKIDELLDDIAVTIPDVIRDIKSELIKLTREK